MSDDLAGILNDTKVLLEIGDAMAELVGTGIDQAGIGDGTGPANVPNILGKRAVARAAHHRMLRDGTTKWADLFSLAHIEAIAVDAPAELRDRLLKSAALAALWVSALDRAHADDLAYTETRISRVLLNPTTEEQA